MQPGCSTAGAAGRWPCGMHTAVLVRALQRGPLPSQADLNGDELEHSGMGNVPTQLFYHRKREGECPQLGKLQEKQFPPQSCIAS